MLTDSFALLSLQIAVKPIVVGRSFPPTYLPNTLFVFKKIE